MKKIIKIFKAFFVITKFCFKYAIKAAADYDRALQEVQTMQEGE